MRTMHGTSKPARAERTSCISSATFAAERRRVETATLPDWMWVSTSVNPASVRAARSSAIFTNRPPTFTARRKAT